MPLSSFTLRLGQGEAAATSAWREEFSSPGMSAGQLSPASLFFDHEEPQATEEPPLITRVTFTTSSATPPSNGTCRPSWGLGGSAQLHCPGGRTQVNFLGLVSCSWAKVRWIWSKIPPSVPQRQWQ